MFVYDPLNPTCRLCYAKAECAWSTISTSFYSCLYCSSSTR